MPNQPTLKFHGIHIRRQLIYILLILILMSCEETYEAPPLPNTSSQSIEPVEGTYRLSNPDSLTWTTHQFPGMESFTTRPFNLEDAPTEFFELESADSIKGEFKTKAINWDSLETKPLDFNNWPREELKFRVKQLGKPRLKKAENLTINPISSVGVSSVESEFGIEENIYTVLRDQDNMLWFGTANSVVKYDGNQLEIYSTDEGLTLNIVNSIFEDSRGLYWVGDGNSLKAVDFDNNLIYEVAVSLNLPRAFNIMEDHLGRLWVTNNGLGFTLVDIDNNSISQFTVEQGLQHPFSIAVMQAPDNTIWLSSPLGLNILDFGKNTNTLFTAKDALGTMAVAVPTVAPNGDYWISIGDGIIILNQEKDTLTHLSADNIANLEDLSVITHHADSFWVGTVEGYLHNIDWKKKTYKTYTLDPGANKVVYEFTFDMNDQVWVSLITGGVYVVDIKGNQPANITPQKGLVDKNVWATLQATDGTKWIGTYNGVDVINLEEKTIKHLTTSDGLLENYNTSLYEDSDNRIWLFENQAGITLINSNRDKAYIMHVADLFDGERLTTIVELDKNTFAIGTSIGKLYYLNINTGEFKSIQIGPPATRSRITDIVKTDSNTLWTSNTDVGIYRINLQDNTIRKVVGNNILDINSAFSIALEKNHLWSASFQGLHMIDLSTDKTYTLTTKHGLPANDIYDIVIKDERVYAGTSNGLAVVSIEQDKADSPINWTVRSIGRQQGLAHVDFAQNSMSIDEQGRIWGGVDSEALTVIEDVKDNTDIPAASITGLSIYNEHLDVNKSDNLILNIESDTIWAPNNLGFISREEYFERTNKDTLNLQFSGTYGPYDLPKDLELPPDQNFLTFSYNAFQFRDQDKLLYTYFLEGIDRNWSEITTQTKTENYRDLPPGDYVFKVAAKNIYSNWGTPAEYSFTILPHWWQTWWARALFVLFLSILIWSVTVYRSKWLKRENRLLEEKVNVRTKQLQDKIEQLKSTQNQLVQSEKMASLGELTAGIAHEIQNPLNFVNNFSELNKELLEEMKEELESGNLEEAKLIAVDIQENENKILHHGKRADSIVKGMLQHSRSNSGERIPTNINVLADEYLRLAYHGLRAKDKSFNATLETDFDKSLKEIPMVAQDMGRVILNIINNALYAVKEKQSKVNNSTYIPTVKIMTKKETRDVLITIKDNGTGIPNHVRDKIFQPFFTTKSAGQGTGLGLSMSYDIIKSHGGELIVDSEEGEGTTFIIKLPINQ